MNFELIGKITTAFGIIAIIMVVLCVFVVIKEFVTDWINSWPEKVRTFFAFFSVMGIIYIFICFNILFVMKR